MKRIISAFLVILMILNSLPILAAENSSDTKVFLPSELGQIIGMAGMKYVTMQDEKGSEYFHITAGPGTYNLAGLNLWVSPKDFSITEYNYVKVGYRTDTSSKIVDISAKSSIGESWLASTAHPTVNADGFWHEFITDTSGIVHGAGALPDGETGINLVLKPFGTGKVELLKTYYFDIAYIIFSNDKTALEKYDLISSLDNSVPAESEAMPEINVSDTEENAQPSENTVTGDSVIPSLSELGSYMGMAGMKIVTLEDDAEYMHITSGPGSYTLAGLKFWLKPKHFSITEFKYIKVEYRTDTPSAIADISANSSTGESWLASTDHPTLTTDGEWHDFIIDTSKLNLGAGALKSGETGIELIIKPFGVGNVTLDNEYYFDLRYVAFFKDKQAAEEFDYNSVPDIDIGSFELEDANVTYTKADNALIKKYMNETDALIAEIVNSDTSVDVTGTKYYVSNSGNDSNDGLTPETAWQTIGKINKFEGFKEGDGVFFKRGDSWRITGSLLTQNGVTYSAYGSGSKPKIIASVDASGADKWIETEYENVYAFNEKIDWVSRNVGTIIFDGGRAWGIHVQPTKSTGDRLDNGTVFNGLETYSIPVSKFDGHGDLKGNLEFYHNPETNTLYLYSKNGNPGDVFTKIELADKGHAIYMADAENVTIDNIEIFGSGSHGIAGGSVKNVTVQYCVLSWIGGSDQNTTRFNRDYGVRFGNAVESYGDSENFTIRYCYASQVYDCCWTVQHLDNATFKNIEMYKNVTEFCNTGLEVWQRSGSVSGLNLHDNYTRFNGFGWSHQRPEKDGNFFYGGETGLDSKFENNNITNNINLFASTFALRARVTGPKQYNFHDNVYVMESDKYVGRLAADPGSGQGLMKEFKFTEEEIKQAVASGFEQGTDYYYTDPSPYENMYALCKPQNGVYLFNDIDEGFWGRDAIDYVVLNEYFNGVSTNEFAPNQPMTRAMLAVVLSRMAGQSEMKARNVYNDVDANAWFASGVTWARMANVARPDTNFRPNDNITREELADMLYRYAKNVTTKIDISNAPVFADSASITSDYVDAIAFCSKYGILSGYEDNTVKPTNKATRAEVATMIKRFCKFLES